MKKLTQKERDFLLEAAEMIDRGYPQYSCNAIDRAVNNVVCIGSRTELRAKYAEFYGKSSDETWFDDDEDISYDDEVFGREARVLLLLTFAELG